MTYYLSRFENKRFGKVGRGVQRKERSWPVSRVLSNALQHSGSHSSGPSVTWRLKQPTRGQHEQRYRPPIWSCSGWGLPCHPCYQGCGGLLPHRFTIAVLISETWAVCSLWHFPSPRGVRSLTGILLCGARTFLCASELRSDCLTSFPAYSTRCVARFGKFAGDRQLGGSNDVLHDVGARGHIIAQDQPAMCYRMAH
jgi:hypothetical protein